MIDGVDANTLKYRYGPVSFVAAAANIFIVGLILWIFAPYTIFLPQFYVFLLADVVVAVLLIRRSGKPGQIGRGMLIGLLAVPAALVVFIPVYLVAGAIGPI